MVLELFAFIGLVFGALAAGVAYLITYNEYRKHEFKGARLQRISLQAAAFAFFFFLALSLALGYLLPGLV